MALIAVIAVIAWALVLGDRYRRRMERLRGDEDRSDTLERAVARTSWMRWGR